MYRDEFSGGASFDGTSRFGIYRQLPDGSWRYVTDERSFVSPSVRVPFVDDPCRIEPDNVSVESAFYQFEVTLDIIDQNYMIAYQRCCRNRSVSNIDVDNVGVVLDAIITPLAQRTGNSSATFKEYPPIFICTGFPLQVDLSGVDVEEDSLVYSFCIPLAAGGSGGPTCETSTEPNPRFCLPPYDEVSFLPPYSFQAPMGGNPLVTINPETGFITGTPELTGQYVIGICIEEYRDGELLSVLRRDFQFNALPCSKEIQAIIEADEVFVGNSNQEISIIKACGDSIVNLVSLSNVDDNIDNYTWTIFDAKDSLIVEESGVEISEFETKLTELGTYSGWMIINDGFDCPDTAFYDIQVLPGMKTQFSYLEDSCYMDEILFIDESTTNDENGSIDNWTWDFENNNLSMTQNTTFRYQDRGIKRVTLISEDTNGCRDTMIRFIEVEPPHDSIVYRDQYLKLCYGDTLPFAEDFLVKEGEYLGVFSSDESGCDTAEVTLTLEYYQKPEETYQQSTICAGDTIEYYGKVYNSDGRFQSSTLTQFDGCDSIIHILDLTIEDPAEIQFDSNYVFLPAYLDIDMPVQVSGAYQTANWEPITGLECNTCPLTTVNEINDALYTLELITEAGCRSIDSVFLDFKLVPEKYFLPNILSRTSADGINNRFFLQSLEEVSDEVTYDLYIYNRWGNLIYSVETAPLNDPALGWSSFQSEMGMYVYRIDIQDFFELKSMTGSIQVID